jgi:hypothetical protein
VRTLPAESEELRAVAICRVNAPLPDLPGIAVQAFGGAWFLSGSFTAVEAALAALDRCGSLSAVSRALLAL